jgi:hypothetical protein
MVAASIAPQAKNAPRIQPVIILTTLMPTIPGDSKRDP